MMQSSYGADNNYDEDDPFAPNPFRPQQQQQQPQQQQPSYNTQQQQPQQQQPSYNTQQQTYPQQGNTVNYSMPQQQQPNVQYLSGTMDQNAANQPAAAVPTSSFLSWSNNNCMTCLKMETYQVYFDVDTTDILGRLKASLLFFHLPDYFRVDTLGDSRNVNSPDDETTTTPNDTLRKGPDLYGPLWIACTLVFTLAVTSNMLLYWNHHWQHFNNKTPTTTTTNSTSYTPPEPIDSFEYDLTHLIHALSVVTTFSIGLPTFFWLATICMGMTKVPWVMWICCYGYCLVPYIVITSLLLWMPWWSAVQWVLLMLATLASGCLVLRNLANPLLQQDPNKAATFVLAFPVTHFIFMCVLKFSFYTK